MHCGRPLAWYENIPLVSFGALRGRCRTCQGRIPWQYPLVELITAALFGLAAWHQLDWFSRFLSIGGLSGIAFWWWALQLWRDFFFIPLLFFIFVYDLQYQIILSGLVWAGAVAALVFNLILGSPSLSLTAYRLLLGTIIGGGFFLFQYLVSKGRWIGGGDVRLGVMMGALLGWPQIIVALFASYLLGSLTVLPLLALKKKHLRSEIPFGTFLVIGTLIALWWGSDLIYWYRGVVGF